MTVVNQRVRIRVSDSLGDDKVVVPSTIKDLLPIAEPVALSVGSYECKVLAESHSDDRLMLLPPSRAYALGLTDGMITNLRASSSGLRLGPVIGIFLSVRNLRKIIQGQARRITNLANANRRICNVLYAFSIPSIDWRNQRITGYHYRYDTNTWEQRSFPFPDVLYDRAGSFPSSHRRVLSSIRRRFDLCGIIRLNALSHFNKWQTYEALSQFPSVRPYLLDTVLCRDPADITDMLGKYGTVYLKRVRGSNGRNVMKLTLQDEGFRVGYFKSRLTNLTFVSWDDALAHINSFFAGSPFIVQKAVEGVTFHGGLVDIRVLIQKDETGEWKITARPVRFGRPGCAISSTRSGSKVYDFDKAFTLLGFSPDQIDQLRENVDHLTFTAVGALEEAYGSFGELGIDVGFDRNLHPFFIESNAKPAKDTILMLGQAETTREAYARPLRYAQYLAGFSQLPAPSGAATSSRRDDAHSERHDSEESPAVPVAGLPTESATPPAAGSLSRKIPALSRLSLQPHARPPRLIKGR